MYVAVKGGERAIDNAHAWLAEERRGDLSVAELSVAQIREQLSLAVNRAVQQCLKEQTHHGARCAAQAHRPAWSLEPRPPTFAPPESP